MSVGIFCRVSLHLSLVEKYLASGGANKSEREWKCETVGGEEFNPELSIFIEQSTSMEAVWAMARSRWRSGAVVASGRVRPHLGCGHNRGGPARSHPRLAASNGHFDHVTIGDSL